MKPEFCKDCLLYSRGDGYAFGEGPEDAKTLLLGEALGAEEALQGRPFVGGAGRTLNHLLYKAGVARSSLYVTNIVRCRPPGNRNPTDTEARYCMEQHKLLEFMKQFNLVIPMGNVALRFITGKHGIMKWRGSVFAVNKQKILPTLHPAAVMRTQELIPASVADFRRIPSASATRIFEPTKQEYVTDGDNDDIRACLAAATPFAFDVETDRGAPRPGSITILGLSNKLGTAVVLSDIRGRWEPLTKLFAGKALKIGQNITFDISHLKAHGIPVAKPWFDTMIAHHLVLSDVPNDLGFIASLYTDIPYWKHMSDSDLKWYNATDADATFRIYEVLAPEIKRLGMQRIFQTSMDVIPLLSEMRDIGVRVNTKKQVQWKIALERSITRYEQELVALSGDPLFNWRSPQQVKTLLYDKMGFPRQYRRGTNTATSDEPALEKLFQLAPSRAIKLLLTVRKLGKLSSTYFTPLLTVDERAHSSYLLHGTATGRLASRDPNLQNVPKGRARNIYIPDDGKVFLSADYNQIEMRIQAILAGEREQLEAFARGEDIHTWNAALMYEKPVSEITPKDRKETKDMTYGLNYGKGVRSLAIDLGVSVAEAQRRIDRYFKALPRVKAWRQDILRRATINGYLANPFGRRRYFFGMAEAPKVYNFLPQSTALDVLLEALVRLYRKLPKDARGVLTVHDQVLVECLEADVPRVRKCIKTAMEHPVDILDNYVFPVDIKVGETWGDCD